MEIKKIYEEYFDLIDSYFGSIKHHLSEDELNHIDLGRKIASYPLVSDLILDATEDINHEIYSFWEKNGKNIVDYSKKSSDLKCLYSGDITPAYVERFVKKSVLYVDTIVVPDPIINLTLMQSQIISDRKYYLNKLIRHVFNIRKLRKLALADTGNRPILIFPTNIQLLQSEKKDSLFKIANDKFVAYINSVFATNYKSHEECIEFVGHLQNAEEILGATQDKDLLPPFFRASKSLSNFLRDFQGTAKVGPEIFTGKTVGWYFGLYIHSQFIRVEEHKTFCEMLSAEPIYDYDLPWFFYNHNLTDKGIDYGIINSLQKDKFEWIGNNDIPMEAYSYLREKGELSYMRSLLRNGITDLKVKKDNDLLETSRQLESNFADAFSQQKAETKSLQKEVSAIAKQDIPITVGATLIGCIPIYGGIISILNAGRDVARLVKKRSQMNQKAKDAESGVINLLMSSNEEKR